MMMSFDFIKLWKRYSKEKQGIEENCKQMTLQRMARFHIVTHFSARTRFSMDYAGLVWTGSLLRVPNIRDAFSKEYE
jgi:hypothetical protein